MKARMLIIDPQNDFCDIPGAALPVSGADADMQRLAQFIAAARNNISEVIVTLDSHASIGIERTTFWLKDHAEPVAPFTEITEQQVRDGQFRPRDERLMPEVLAYLHALEQGGRYRLMVWPVHCVLGTWGHNIHASVAASIAQWEEYSQRPAFRVLKGMNPMTEQYSAVQAEVPSDADPQTQTNHRLLSRARPADGLLLVAGEAASHCVAATMEHLFKDMSLEQRRRIAILRDCMSPVSGFENAADKFFEAAIGFGARVITTTEALRELSPAGN
jgi:nicotinamidase/pyrazinamidase